jgi:hypothetical protein
MACWDINDKRPNENSAAALQPEWGPRLGGQDNELVRLGHNQLLVFRRFEIVSIFLLTFTMTYQSAGWQHLQINAAASLTLWLLEF